MKNFIETLAKIGIGIVAIKVIGWVIVIALIIWVISLIF